MIVLRAEAKDIEALNINDFFTGHTLGLDIHGMHYYPCDRYCKYNEEELQKPENKDLLVLFDSLEKVEFETIEKPKIDEI